ncbi:MAG: PqqD family protein [Gemmatimonas sp.]
MTKHFRRHADIRLTALEGEGVVLHMGSRRYFTVSETGLSILEAMKTPSTFEQLVDAIMTEYEVAPDRASTSVQAFLTQCINAQVVLEETL